MSNFRVGDVCDYQTATGEIKRIRLARADDLGSLYDTVGCSYSKGALAYLTLKGRPVLVGDVLVKELCGDLYVALTDIQSAAETHRAYNAGWAHKDGTPIAEPDVGAVKLVADASVAPGDVRVIGENGGLEWKSAKVVNSPKRQALSDYVAAEMVKAINKNGHWFNREQLPRRLFNADPRVKAAMAKLETPQYEKAYARGIFGYAPEVQWAAAAWALAEEITK